MRKLANVLSVVVLTAAMVACAHSATRGTVAMLADDGNAHVSLGRGEINEGDKVTFYDNECQERSGGTRGGAPSVDICRKVIIGTGEVTRILSNEYSVVRLSPGVEVKEGMIVERGMPAFAE